MTRPPGADILAAQVWFVLSALVLGLSQVAWWRRLTAWRASGRLTPNIVVVGATDNARKFIEKARDSGKLAVLGIFDDRLDRSPDEVSGVPVLGDTMALLSHRIMPYVDRVVITVPPHAQGRVRQLIEKLKVLPNEVILFLDFEGDAAQSAALSRLAEAPLARVSGAGPDDGRVLVKRLEDMVLGALALLLAIPVMALVALAVRLDSPGPVLFRQRRHGFNNEEIVVWKFRSMRHESADATASRQVIANDERVTRVGRFIRKFSLDELPQLFNVLKGEMSLVGPRPHAIGMKTGEVESRQACGRIRLAPPYEAGRHGLGRRARFARSSAYARGRPSPGRAGRRIYRAPDPMAGPVHPGLDHSVPSARRPRGHPVNAPIREWVSENGASHAPSPVCQC